MLRNNISLLIILLIACTSIVFHTSFAFAQPLAIEPKSIEEIDSTNYAPGDIEILPDGGVRLSTKDGLVLTLNDAGQVIALTLNKEPLSIDAAFPLVVRDLSQANTPNSPNQLANFSFEEGDRGWKPLMHSNVEIEVISNSAHEGTNALAIRSHDQDGIGAVISDPISVTAGKRYRVSGHFKLEFGYVDEGNNPTFWQDSLYTGGSSISGLYLQWLDVSGAPLFENPVFAAPLHWNAQDWHKITREITAPVGAASVQVIAGVKPVTGSAWIDNLAWIESPEKDQPLEGSLQIEADHVIQVGQLNGLEIAVTYTPYSDHIAITTTIQDTTGDPRALDVAWGLPINLEGWNWWDGIRENRLIEANSDYARSVSADVAGYLPISLYPYSLIKNGQRGLNLAIPLDSPRYVLMHYDGAANRFEGRAHLGISPEAQKLDDTAGFTLLLYQTEPTWGLRASAEKHAQFNPDWYDTPADFSGYSDFIREHFSAKGKGTARLEEHNDNDVYAAQYMVYELSVYMEEGDQPRPSFAEAWQSLEELANTESTRASYPSSVICDSSGEPHLKLISVTPWSGYRWNPIWIPNMDPDIPNGFGSYKLAELEKLFSDTYQADLTLDGIFIDNFISTSTMDMCPEHLAAADIPLTYDPNTYQPATHTASAGWEFITELRALLDAQPEPYRSISINFWAMNIPTLLTPYIDAFGGEGASAKGSNWTPEILDYRMTTAMGRPRLFANQQPDPTYEQIEAFAHEAIFYG
ncbi:MAG: carbohydrate binding domain-containing protein, partial [Chloroflexi bacterium]|nr:carbohydrate binding domain-containing protein [Chloroflexota bacterium]